MVDDCSYVSIYSCTFLQWADVGETKTLVNLCYVLSF